MQRMSFLNCRKKKKKKKSCFNQICIVDSQLWLDTDYVQLLWLGKSLVKVDWVLFRYKQNCDIAHTW